jgi:superfamily II DNA/RNA helicase
LVINFDCPYNKTEYHHRVGRTGRYNTLGNSITFFQENQKAILDDIRKEDQNKLIEINSIDENLIELLMKDYEEIKEHNIFDPEINKKIEGINQAIPISNVSIEDLNKENYLSNKRRRTQYEKESLISHWVDADEKIFDEENFKYLNEEIEEAQENEIIDFDLEENIINNSQGNSEALKVKGFNLKEKGREGFCDSPNKNKFCIYCNFMKIFDD